MFRLIISIALFSASVSATLMDRFYNWAETHKIAVPEGEHEFLHLLTNWKNNDRIIDETSKLQRSRWGWSIVNFS